MTRGMEMRSAARAGAYGVAIDIVRSCQHPGSCRTAGATGTFGDVINRHHFPPGNG